MKKQTSFYSIRAMLIGSALLATLGVSKTVADPFSFATGDLVVSTVSDPNLANPVNNDLDTASAITLDQFQLSSGGTVASSAGSLTLAQTNVGNDSAISGEYGSASEGILQDSVNGQYLTIMGYGVNANTFNTSGGTTGAYATAALGQTTSIAGGATVVPRVVGLIGADGSVDTSTALTGVFNTNNPRSVATVDGTSFYVSGQGATKTDSTGGVFYATLGATTATPLFTSANTTETRTVSINSTLTGSNTLYFSRDAKGAGSGNNNTSDINSITTAGGALPTSSSGATVTRLIPGAASTTSSPNNFASIDLNSALDNIVNSGRNGSFVYLSPEQYFFASSTVMYVTDSGQPKNGNADAAALGEGGLQKWTFAAGKWTLQYDLSVGLGLVNNDKLGLATNTNTTPGVTGLFGLTGEVVGGNVELFATSYGLNELSQSYLYGITDSLAATSAANGESFTTLETAPAGTLFRGVAFSPQAAPEPSETAMMIIALLSGLAFAWKRQKSPQA